MTDIITPQPETAIQNFLVNGGTCQTDLEALKSHNPAELIALATGIATELAESFVHPDGLNNRLRLLGCATRNHALWDYVGAAPVMGVAHRPPEQI